VDTPQPLTGGEVRRQVTPGGATSIEGRSTGDVCGPPPVNMEQRTTVELEAKVLDYVKAGGKIDTLSGIRQVLAGADLGCDAVMYRACKICFSTQNGQGCAALTANALTYCQQRTGAPTAHEAVPAPAAQATLVPVPTTLTMATPAPAPAPVDSPAIRRLVLSLWTDTDDKDRDESVSVRLMLGDEVIGSGGPWGGGEIWGDQENRNNGQPHEFALPLSRAVLLRDVSAIRLEIVKSQHGGNGGRGWHFRSSVLAETAGGRTEVWRSQSTIRLGSGHPATFATSL
jgi:hypothetical protein